MSFHHHNNHHHSTTTTTCCCHHQPPLQPLQPPQPPYITPDPLLLSTIISQLIQTQPQNHPHQHQFQYPHSILTSLIHRIDALESSLARYSSSSSSSSSVSSSSSSSLLRHVAARTIQTHFRSYLVRRSRTLRCLQELSLVKSRVGVLKSSLSSRGFVDFDSLSSFANDLLLHLDSIQSGNKMIRDSKRLITRDIVEFLEMVDGVCVRKREVLTKTVKNTRTTRNDCITPHDKVSAGYGMGSKRGSMNKNERELMANLKKRVERIGRMSRALQDDEVNGAEMEGFEVLENEGDVIDPITNKYRMQNLGSIKKNTLNPNPKKRVCIVEDGNVVRVYDDNGGLRGAFKDTDEIEDSSKDRHDEEEEEVESDGGEQSSQSSGDGKNQNSHHDSRYNQDGDFTFSAPEPVLMEARAGLGTRKPGVKIVG